ncbi:MAG: hypothetical protein MJZ05_04410 [Fibrobacter sp.]|nr:hypothetical protein [Fibrobacter sp.]
MSEKEYSDWQKIDLHIHTDKSRETKNGDYSGAFSIDTLKSKLIENSVQIFSLTDHNIINVDAYEEYYQKYDSETDPLLLLGVEFDIKGSSQNYHTLLIFNTSKVEDVKAFDQKLEAKYLEKNIQSKKDRILEFEDIYDLTRDDSFKDFFFIPHARSSKNIFEGTQSNIDETWRNLILMQSALDKITKQETVEQYRCVFDELLSANFKKKYDIAYINFSDNHNCSQYPCINKGNDGNLSFYYIKGKKSYETIRLAFIDPKSRIKSSDEFNKISKTLNTIDSVEIEENKLLSKSSIKFSPHLNVIIGGRSSGKSLLMWIIGNKIDGVKLKNAQKYKSVVDLEKTKIKAKNDSLSSAKTTLNQKFIYIEQGDIINFFEEKNLSLLALKVEKYEEYNQYSELLNEKKANLERLINNLVDCYSKAYQNTIEKSNFVIHDKDLTNVLTTSHYYYKFSQQEILDGLKSDDYRNLRDELARQIDSLENIKKSTLINFSIEEENEIAKVTEIFKKKHREIENTLRIIQRKVLFLGRIEQLIREIGYQLSEASRLRQNSSENLKNLIHDVQQRFMLRGSLKKSVKAIEEFDYSSSKEISLDDGTTLVRHIKTDEKITDLLMDGISNVLHLNSLFSCLQRLLDSKEVLIKNLKSKEPKDLQKKIASQLTKLYEYMEKPSDYLRYADRSDSQEKSPGYNSEQYLKLMLNSPSIKTIFIDQPEDNLGNNFISEELVQIIRNIKFEKQIFLVTHNPSLVVYGDAECIVFSENNDQKIQYKQLVLEDKDSQKRICKILDGGEYIFNNRAQKYNIHRLKKEIL